MFVTAGLYPAHDWRPFQAQLSSRCTRILLAFTHTSWNVPEPFPSLPNHSEWQEIWWVFLRPVTWKVSRTAVKLSITGISVTCWLRPTPTRQERALFLAPHRPQQSHIPREPFMVLKDKQLFSDIITQSFKLTVLQVCTHEVEKSLRDLYLTLRLKWHQDRLDTVKF